MILSKDIIKPFGFIGIPKFSWRTKGGFTLFECEKIMSACEDEMDAIRETIGTNGDPDVIMNYLKAAAVVAGAHWAKAECFVSPVGGSRVYVITFGKLGQDTYYEYAVGTKR